MHFVHRVISLRLYVGSLRAFFLIRDEVSAIIIAVQFQNLHQQMSTSEQVIVDECEIGQGFRLVLVSLLEI